jgi:hypothetical protein
MPDTLSKLRKDGFDSAVRRGSKQHFKRIIECAGRRVEQARLIGWMAMEQSFQRDMDEATRALDLLEGRG